MLGHSNIVHPGSFFGGMMCAVVCAMIAEVPVQKWTEEHGYAPAPTDRPGRIAYRQRIWLELPLPIKRRARRLQILAILFGLLGFVFSF